MNEEETLIKRLNKYEISKDVLKIYDYCFEDSPYLKTIIIPITVKYVGNMYLNIIHH